MCGLPRWPTRCPSLLENWPLPRCWVGFELVVVAGDALAGARDVVWVQIPLLGPRDLPVGEVADAGHRDRPEQRPGRDDRGVEAFGEAGGARRGAGGVTKLLAEGGPLVDLDQQVGELDLGDLRDDGGLELGGRWVLGLCARRRADQAATVVEAHAGAAVDGELHVLDQPGLLCLERVQALGRVQRPVERDRELLARSRPFAVGQQERGGVEVPAAGGPEQAAVPERVTGIAHHSPSS